MIAKRKGFGADGRLAVGTGILPILHEGRTAVRPYRQAGSLFHHYASRFDTIAYGYKTFENYCILGSESAFASFPLGRPRDVS
jgi:hypothetical protein